MQIRILSIISIVNVLLALFSLTGCFEMQGLNVRPKSGTLVIGSTDVLYVKWLLAETAKEHGLAPQELANSDEIGAYAGGKEGLFRGGGIAYIRLWKHTNPSYLEVDIGAPTSGGATILSKRIFREVKAKLIEHFGVDRIRDTSISIVNPI